MAHTSSKTNVPFGVRPQYLSPTTQSITLAITGPTAVNETQSLTVNSTGYTSTLTVTPPRTFASGTASFTITPILAGQATNGCAQSGGNCNPVTVTVAMKYMLFAYVANYDSNNVSAYTINASTGALTPVTGSPFAAGSEPEGAAIGRQP